MIAMAASIAAVYPHMNHVGGDGFWLIREPSGRVRAMMGAGRAGAKATPRLYRDAGYRRNPGARAAGRAHRAGRGGDLGARRRSRQSANRRHKLPLDVLLAPAIRHARDGYVVTRSQTRLTAEKLPEMKDCGWLRGRFPRRRQGAGGGCASSSRARLPPRLSILALAGLDDFYRGDVGREIASDLERIGSPVTRADLEKFEARSRRAAQRPDASRHALQHAAADARLGLADDPGAVRSPARHARGKASSTSTAWSKRPSAPSACATASSPIRTRSTSISRNSCHRNFSIAKPARSTPARPRAGRRLTAKATPSGWARRTPAAWSSPTSSRSTGSSAPAACCRRPAC